MVPPWNIRLSSTPWNSMDTPDGHSMKFNRIPWTSMEFYGTPWTFHGTLWNSMDTQWHTMELHGTPQTLESHAWSSMHMPWKLHGVPWNSMKSMEFHGVISHGNCTHKNRVVGLIML